MALSPALSYHLKSIEPPEDLKPVLNGSYSCVSSIDDEFIKERSCCLPNHQFTKWRSAALCISGASVFTEIILGIAGLALAIKWRSPAALGFATDAVLDVLTTLVVVWRYVGVQGAVYSWPRERKAVICISVLFCISGICIAAKAIFNLIKERQPYAPYSLLALATVGVVTLSLLLWGKVVIAKKLESRSIYIDAINTGCGVVMAFMMIVSLLVYHYTKYWFVDSTCAILISMFLFVFGARSLFVMLFPVELIAEPF